MVESRFPEARLYRRLFTQIRPAWRGVLGLFLLGQLATPIALLGPLPLQIAVDHAIGGRPIPGWIDFILPAGVPRSPATLAGVAALLIVVLALLGQLQTRALAILTTTTAQRLVLRFRTVLFAHVQRLSLAYHDTRGSTDSAHRISFDAPAIQFVVIDGALPFVTSAIALVAIVAVTMRLDWQLALVGLTVSPFLFVLSHRYRRPLRSKYREVKDYESRALSVVQESLGALRVVKAFGQEDREGQRFTDRAEEGVRAQYQLALYEGRFSLLIGLTTAIGTAATLVIGVSHVGAGTLTLGELLLIMAYLAQMYAPLTTISRKVASIQGHLASLDRAMALLDEAPEVPERPGAKPLQRAMGKFDVRNVTFGYSSERVILRGVSFELAPAARVGISGTTGAGKTTLVNLLTRFYDPVHGEILLDGVDLRDYRLADLRSQFAIVLQEPVLFSSTVGENIAYARPDASQNDVEAAARAANAHDFIVGLPDGYDTLVGERGMRLSGGERQRISLARAFLKDAPILILDEPTSSVDTGTETVIMDAMERLMRGRTTLMIAHRLSTLDRCDVRLILEGGRVTPASDVRPAARSTELAEGGAPHAAAGSDNG